jgi:hypothetical protein
LQNQRSEAQIQVPTIEIVWRIFFLEQGIWLYHHWLCKDLDPTLCLIWDPVLHGQHLIQSVEVCLHIVSPKKLCEWRKALLDSKQQHVVINSHLNLNDTSLYDSTDLSYKPLLMGWQLWIQDKRTTSDVLCHCSKVISKPPLINFKCSHVVYLCVVM